MEPLGEALPNQEIFRRLARAMGYSEPELYESDAAIIATVLRKAGLVEDFRYARRPRHRAGLARAAHPIRRSDAFPPRAGASKLPRHVPKLMATRACHCPWPTPGQPGAVYACSRRPHPGS